MCSQTNITDYNYMLWENVIIFFKLLSGRTGGLQNGILALIQGKIHLYIVGDQFNQSTNQPVFKK